MPDDKTVDIDTSGPGAEVELPEENKPEPNEVEVSNANTEDSVESTDSPEKPSEQPNVQASEQTPRS